MHSHSPEVKPRGENSSNIQTVDSKENSAFLFLFFKTFSFAKAPPFVTKLRQWRNKLWVRVSVPS